MFSINVILVTVNLIIVLQFRLRLLIFTCVDWCKVQLVEIFLHNQRSHCISKRAETVFGIIFDICFFCFSFGWRRSIYCSVLTQETSFFSRTLTAVHDNILEDLVFPAEIVGKRIRVKLDCSRIIKVHLDKSQQTNVEHKVKQWSW